MSPKNTDGHGTAQIRDSEGKTSPLRLRSELYELLIAARSQQMRTSWATAALFSIKAKFNLMKILTLIFGNVNPN
jgi:hypothetical protein